MVAGSKFGSKCRVDVSKKYDDIFELIEIHRLRKIGGDFLHEVFPRFCFALQI